MGGVDVYIRVFLTSALVGGSGQFHDPSALPSEKVPLIHIGKEVEWTSEPVWTI
jgi:hypothetical protein